MSPFVRDFLAVLQLLGIGIAFLLLCALCAWGWRALRRWRQVRTIRRTLLWDDRRKP